VKYVNRRVALVGVIPVIVAAVGLASASAASAPPGIKAITNPPAALTTPPATKPKYITIRVWSGAYQKAFAASVGAQFTKATGVAIHWDTSDEFVSYQKIDKEIRAGSRPEADASMQAQQRAYLDAARGLTLPISAKVAPNMLKATRAIAAPEGTPAGATTWAYANPYSVTVTFVVNSAKVNPALLTKWSDLSNPKFKHSVVFDQIYSSTAIPLAKSMGIDVTKGAPGNLDPVWARIKALRPQLASIGSGSDVTTALTNGTATIGVTCTCNAVAALQAGKKIKLVVPKDGMYIVADAYYIHKNIPPANYYYAQLFANYLYSNATQSYLAKDQALVPTVSTATVPAYMKAQPDAFPLTAAEIASAHGIVAPIPVMAHYDTQWQVAFENAIK
jgi:putative spermidine/putrescine transport system substrate-binding protein